MTSSNGNIFRVTSPLWGEFTGHRRIPRKRPMTRSFDVFFDLRLHKRLNKQSRHWWSETSSCSLWRNCNVIASNSQEIRITMRDILSTSMNFKVGSCIHCGPYHKCLTLITWWRHQMETFSALLAICAGNSPVPGEFPAQRPVTRSLDVFFDLRLNERLSKQSWGWWLETLSCPFWRHRNDTLLNPSSDLPSFWFNT